MNATFSFWESAHVAERLYGNTTSAWEGPLIPPDPSVHSTNPLATHSWLTTADGFLFNHFDLNDFD